MSVALALLGSAALSSAGQLWANQKNLDQQQSNNDLSVNLANTSHQREVADLEAAGLNPILSAGGSGASMPSLGVATQQNPLSEIANSSKSAARFISDEYSASVQGQQLVNDYQKTINDAASHEKAASVISAENDRLLAEAENDAIRQELGEEALPNGHGVKFNKAQHDKTIDLIREGVRSDMKVRSNQNWRNNVSTFMPLAAPISANSAKGLGTASQRAALKLIK